MVDRTAWSLQTIKKFSTKARLLAVNSAHNAHLVQQAFENVWRSILYLILKIFLVIKCIP